MKTALVLALALAAGASAQQQDTRRFHRYERQAYTVADFQAKGYVLDIGGGGEGIIGQIKPAQVVAIDLYKRELLEAPPGPLKIVMDATDLKFLDGSFETVTAFFSLMYMKPDVQEKVFAEAYRVLQPGGRWLIWEANIPARPNQDTDVVAFYWTFKLPGGKEVQTGYGTPWPEKPLDPAHYRALATKAGFKVGTLKEEGRGFFLELQK